MLLGVGSKETKGMVVAPSSAWMLKVTSGVLVLTIRGDVQPFVPADFLSRSRI